LFDRLGLSGVVKCFDRLKTTGFDRRIFVLQRRFADRWEFRFSRCGSRFCNRLGRDLFLARFDSGWEVRRRLLRFVDRIHLHVDHRLYWQEADHACHRRCGWKGRDIK
jgi:hypothetical protein